MSDSILIAYWGEPYYDVMFAVINDDSLPQDRRYVTLTGCMEARLLQGSVTEILEYWPTDSAYIENTSNRCNYWRKTLREQGCRIGRVPPGQRPQFDISE